MSYDDDEKKLDREGAGSAPEEEIEIVEKPIEDDERLSADQRDDDDEIEEKRARRREEKRVRKENRDKAKARDKQELNQLRREKDELAQRLANIEARQLQSDTRSIDEGLQAATAQYQRAEAAFNEAVTKNDGATATRAMRLRDEAAAEFQRLNGIKARVQQAPQPQRQTGADQTVVNLAKDFVEDHPWADPKNKTTDSRLAQAIDTELAEEGYDPRTPDYWDELEDRLRKHLPHKFKREASAPPTGSSRGGAAPTRTQVYVSPERRAAMEQDGTWDDPVARKRMLKYYAEYDRNNAAR